LGALLDLKFCLGIRVLSKRIVFTENGKRKTKKKTFLLSPRGRQFDQRLAEELVKLKEITFVCGRYEGVDQRVSDYMVDEEVSIGPYVLAGGELGALTIIEAVARLVPGVLGNPQQQTFDGFGIFRFFNLGEIVLGQPESGDKPGISGDIFIFSQIAVPFITGYSAD